MAELDYSGTLDASGSSDALVIDEPFYIVLSGTWTGTVALEASADGGETFVNCLLPDGSPSAFTTNGLIAVPHVFGRATIFRLTFTHASGTLAWRLFR
jgi:hypothetical protein